MSNLVPRAIFSGMKIARRKRVGDVCLNNEYEIKWYGPSHLDLDLLLLILSSGISMGREMVVSVLTMNLRSNKMVQAPL